MWPECATIALQDSPPAERCKHEVENCITVARVSRHVHSTCTGFRMGWCMRYKRKFPQRSSIVQTSGQATLLLPDHSEMPPNSQQNARVNCGHREDDTARARADPLPRFAEWQQVACIGASHRVQVAQPRSSSGGCASGCSCQSSN